jgi:threonylcarbamoyladenosine tRNA methylthiotransferase MtaB
MSNSIEKVAIHTLGCKLNFSESSTIARDFVNKGFSIVKDFENANIHIINTCSVTDNSDKKTKRLINKITRTSDHPYITIIGCYAQL